MLRALRPALPLLALAASLAPAHAADVAAPRVRVLRAWDETIKVDGQDVPRRVEIVFDYDRGEARQVERLPGGEVKATVLLHEQPAPSAEEIEEAVSLIRGDASLGRVLQRTRAVPTGGFVLEEPEGRCGLRTRCLQILVMAPESYGLLRRVVVDLTRRKIVYRSYTGLEGRQGDVR